MKILYLTFLIAVSFSSIAKEPNFEKALMVKEKDIEWKGNKGKSYCYIYEDIAILQISTGKGADVIYLNKKKLSDDAESICKSDLKESFRIKHGEWFWGKFNNFILLTTVDGFGMLSHFWIVDSKTGELKINSPLDNSAGREPLLIVEAGKIKIKYNTVITATCSLTSNNKKCWDKTLLNNKIFPIRKLEFPNCVASIKKEYEWDKKHNGFYSTMPYDDYLKVQEQNYMQISMSAEIEDLLNPKIKILGGETFCYPQP